MVKVEDIEIMGWRKAIKGMRNPLNSWDKMDSGTGCSHRNTWGKEEYGVRLCQKCGVIYDSRCVCTGTDKGFKLGPNDLDLACRLIKAGPEHRKFLRMIHVQMDITAPTYWWAEFDTYKIATVRNSCSKMHKIHVKTFELDDFAHEGCMKVDIAKEALINTINACEQLRLMFNETKDRKYWRALIELLPEGYMLKATWDGSLETVLSILKQRDHHKLHEEWEPFRQAMFDNIPYCKEFYEAYIGKDE